MRRILCALLALSVWLLGMPALSEETSEGYTSVVIEFLEAERDGDWGAANTCCIGYYLNVQMDGLPILTRLIVFPSMQDIHVVSAEPTASGMLVTASVNAVDVEAAQPDEGAFLPEEQWLVNLLYGGLTNPYATAEALSGSEVAYLLDNYRTLCRDEPAPRKTWEIPFMVVDTDEGWKINWETSIDKWPAEALSVKPLSWGALTYDYPQRRYYATDAWYRLSEYIADNRTYEEFLQEASTRELFRLLGTPEWNVWLRMEAQGNADRLYDFRVEDDAGQCAVLPVSYSERGLIIVDRQWARFGGAKRGALEMRLNATVGQPLGDVAIVCKERVNPFSPMYHVRDHSISLSGVPYFSGVPEGGVTVTAERVSRVDTAKEQLSPDGETLAYDTLGQLMEGEDGGGGVSVYQYKPEDVDELPVVNSKYALFRIEGKITKKSGDFGVYDVAFDLTLPVDGVWVESHEECAECGQMDMFDIYGADAVVMEELDGAMFDVQVLLRTDGRTEDEMLAQLRALPLTATFSGEEWDFSYEQHGTTTRIGPRISVPVDLSGI